MAFMAVLESDLRALSAEARRRYPAVKEGAEHAILKVTALFTVIRTHANIYLLDVFVYAFIPVCLYLWMNVN